MVVYTVSIGPKDTLQPALFPERADYICFSDRPVEARGWQRRSLKDTGMGARRTSRLPKMQPNIYLPEYEISLYHDANFQLQVDPQTFCDTHLNGVNLAMYRHPERDCLYDEAVICEGFKLDTPDRFHQQVEWCKAAGMPRHWGLFQGSVIARRHLEPEIIELGRVWRTEYTFGSCRDQISLAFAMWTTEGLYGVIPGKVYNCPEFTHRGH